MTIYLYETLKNLKYTDSSKIIIQGEVDAIDDKKKRATTFVCFEKNVSSMFDSLVAGNYGVIQEPNVIIAPILSELELYRSKLECSRLQAKAVLYQNGMLDAVNALIEQSDFLVQMAWNEAQVIRRTSPIIEVLKSQIKWPDGSSLSDEDLDALFETAKTIEF